MTDCSLGDAFEVLSCPFRSTVLQCGARLYIHTLTSGPCSSGECFLTGSVFLCNIANLRSVAVLNLLNKVRCNPMLSLHGDLPVPYAPVHVGYTRSFGCTSVNL